MGQLSKPMYFMIWDEDEGGACVGCPQQRFMEFEDRDACQAFALAVHKRDGYVAGTCQIFTGFKLDTEKI